MEEVRKSKWLRLSLVNLQIFNFLISFKSIFVNLAKHEGKCHILNLLLLLLLLLLFQIKIFLYKNYKIIIYIPLILIINAQL